MHIIAQTLNPEARALANLFAATSVGAVVTYAAMTAAIGRDIHARRHLIPRALTIAAKEAGAIFGSVRKVGYQRLAATDAHMLGAHTRGRIRRSAKRTAEAIVSAVSAANDMPDDARRRAFAEVNAMGLIRHLATDKAVSAVVAEPKAEPVAHTMRRFAEAIGATG